jgi:hypothetical protein
MHWRAPSRNYSKPWQKLGKSPRKPRKLMPNELWNAKPSNWKGKKGRDGHWKVDFPPPPRHSEVGGHHEEQTRPMSRGAYKQPKYGHIIPFKPTSSRPSTSMGLSRTSTPSQSGDGGLKFGSDEDDSDEEVPDQNNNIPTKPAIRTYEPGQSCIPRRPASPYVPYNKKTSAERQKIALVKLRALYDGRQQFHQIYTMWDLNRDGGIDVKEFQTQLHHHGFEWLTDEDVECLFHRFVPEDKHVLDYRAFRDFMFAHAINDTVWDSSFNPFKTDKNYGWKSPRLKRHQKRFKVSNPNPWRKTNSRDDEVDNSNTKKYFTPPIVSPLKLPPRTELPPQLQDVMSEHGNKVMRALKRLNGGRLKVCANDFSKILTNLRQRQGVPLTLSDLPALVNYLSLNNGQSVPYHEVIGRLRQAQRKSSLRQRWNENEKLRRLTTNQSLGFSRPGTPRLGYGAAKNNLMVDRLLLIPRRFDGTETPRRDLSRPSTAQSTARRAEFVKNHLKL